ncbi:SDR family NAD(P)-dependent oxidoreductase [Dactylosporangium sucinum]|nr:SDR family oxidoreductase [Dactylosporangium sucinum]
MSDFDLTGRRVIVTGGASGMGAGTVRGFSRLGAQVVSLDLNEEAGGAVAKEVGAAFLTCDVTSQESVESAVKGAAGILGGLDVLVNAAGIAPFGSAAETSLATWERIIAVNATGTFLTNVAVFPHLRDGGGRVINFASSAGIIGLPAKAAYSASKGAVVAWTRTLAIEWAPYGITVNAIAPAIWTPMYDKTRSEMSPEALAAHDAALKRTIPLGGRLGDIERDFLPVIAFVASPASRFMTGQMFAADGGLLPMR